MIAYYVPYILFVIAAVLIIARVFSGKKAPSAPAQSATNALKKTPWSVEGQALVIGVLLVGLTISLFHKQIEELLVKHTSVAVAIIIAVFILSIKGDSLTFIKQGRLIAKVTIITLLAIFVFWPVLEKQNWWQSWQKQKKQVISTPPPTRQNAARERYGVTRTSQPAVLNFPPVAVEPGTITKTGIHYKAGDTITLRQIGEETTNYYILGDVTTEVSSREFVGSSAGPTKPNDTVWLKGGDRPTMVAISIARP